MSIGAAMRGTVTALFVGCAMVLSACGDDRCYRQDESSGGSAAPEITDFDLHSQLGTDPWELIFSVAFEDNGDLGWGTAEFSLDGRDSGVRIDLFDSFRQSGVELDAYSGVLSIPLRFSENVQDGAKVWIGLQLEDKAAHLSECYAIELEFDVRSATRWLRKLLWRHA